MAVPKNRHGNLLKAQDLESCYSAQIGHFPYREVNTMHHADR
ncbi:MAG: hypothetical protein ACXW5W_19845 [Candidatus Binatia bacterium]